MLAQSHDAYERAPSGEKIVSAECPRCGSAISRDNHHCPKCGAELVVCLGCKAPNLELAQYCHICGQPMVLSAPNEIAKMFTRETQDFDVLDQAARAIVKLHNIIESIERLELAHQIERTQTISASRVILAQVDRWTPESAPRNLNT